MQSNKLQLFNFNTMQTLLNFFKNTTVERLHQLSKVKQHRYAPDTPKSKLQNRLGSRYYVTEQTKPLAATLLSINYNAPHQRRR